MTMKIGVRMIGPMDATTLIDRLGGTMAVSALLGVKSPSVSEWKANDRIPLDKLIRLAPRAEAQGIATRQELLPDNWAEIWPELARKARKAA